MPQDVVQMGFLLAVLGNSTTLKSCSAVSAEAERLRSLRPRLSPFLGIHATLMHAHIYQKISTEMSTLFVTFKN